MTRKHTRTTQAAIVAGVAVTMTLTGCGSSPADDAAEAIAEGGAEELVEDVTGGEVDVDYESVPDDFPSEVPLVATEVIQSLTTEDEQSTMFSLTLAYDGSVDDLAAVIEEEFADWPETFSQESDGITTKQYLTDDLQVTVSATTGESAGLEGGSVAQYSVTVPAG